MNIHRNEGMHVGVEQRRADPCGAPTFRESTGGEEPAQMSEKEHLLRQAEI